MSVKKITTKDRHGAQVSIEYHEGNAPSKLIEQILGGMVNVPQMEGIPHPGGPKGTDTVPAWLTPGEFVMNAEATRMFEPQIEEMNDAGRAVQRAQGGTIPEYKAEGGYAEPQYLYGGAPVAAPGQTDYDTEAGDEMFSKISDMGEAGLDWVKENPLEAASYGLMLVPGAGGAMMLARGLGAAGKALGVGNKLSKVGKGLGEGLGKGYDKLLKKPITKEVPAKPRMRDGRMVVDTTAPSLTVPAGLGYSIPKVATVGSAAGALGLQGADMLLGDDEEGTQVDGTKPSSSSATGDVFEFLNTTPQEEVDPEAAKKAVEEGDKNIIDKAVSWFSDTFKDVLDKDSLKEAALLYAGSRLLGFDHEGSAAFAGRRYLTQLDADRAAKKAAGTIVSEGDWQTFSKVSPNARVGGRSERLKKVKDGLGREFYVDKQGKRYTSSDMAKLMPQQDYSGLIDKAAESAEKMIEAELLTRPEFENLTDIPKEYNLNAISNGIANYTVNNGLEITEIGDIAVKVVDMIDEQKKYGDVKFDSSLGVQAILDSLVLENPVTEAALVMETDPSSKVSIKQFQGRMESLNMGTPYGDLRPVEKMKLVNELYTLYENDANKQSYINRSRPEAGVNGFMVYLDAIKQAQGNKK